MTNALISHQPPTTFVSVREQDEMGEEFWSAGNLAPLLEHQDWRNFLQVVDKARVTFDQSARTVVNHFGETTKMVSIGSGTQKKINKKK